jgi:hypothetical protein
MNRWFAVSLVVGLVAPHVVRANNPEVDALRQQVKALQAEEKAVVKLIKARYEAVLRTGRLSEQQREAERLALSNQEKQYLALATTPQDQEKIRAQYHLLRTALNSQGNVDATLSAQVRAQERNHVKLVSGLYKAKISELNAAIRAAGKTPTRRR